MPLLKNRDVSSTTTINIQPPSPPLLPPRVPALLITSTTTLSPLSPSPPTPPILPLLHRFLSFLTSQSPTSILLVFVPISLFLYFLTSSSPILLFTTACLGIIPLAGIMGDATEHLADRFGPGVGGLLNASFGNAAELILALFGCFRGLDDLVKSSLCGSMIGNILLVLGMSILMGGLRYKEQRFSKQAAHSEATMAIVAAVAFLVPAIFHSIVTGTGEGGISATDEHPLSLGIAVLLIVTYALMLFFQLRTHAAWFNEKGETSEEATQPLVPPAAEEQRTARGEAGSEGGAALPAADVSEEAAPQTTPVGPFKRGHRTLHSMIAMDPDRVSAMTKKMFARKIVREKQQKEKRQKELEKEMEMNSARGRGGGDEGVNGGGGGANSARRSGQSSPMQMQSMSPRSTRIHRQGTLQENDAEEGGEGGEGDADTRPTPLFYPQISVVNPGLSPDTARGPILPPPPPSAPSSPEEPVPFHSALASLCVSCILVALLSDVLTDSATAAGESLGLSSSFLGLVVVAIIGNAAEHSTAVMAAWHDNLNVSLSIAFGSALQIAMFVCPVVVLASYARSAQYGPMDLIVGELEVFAVAVGGVVSWMVVMGGGSNWLEGLMLLMIYLIIALAFYFLPEGYA